MPRNIVNLLFEAKMLKEIKRSGFHFLGAGIESVAEHTYMTALIALVMSRMEPAADPFRLLAMCLVHDLPEARTGDLNAVQKRYVKADEAKAVADLSRRIDFGGQYREWLEEFNAGKTLEARLAKDADQLSLLLELKSLADIGYRPPHKWMPSVTERVKTPTGRALCRQILQTDWDAWWFASENNRGGTDEQ